MAMVDDRPIRIGIDGRELEGRRRGIGRYICELCRELDYVLPNATVYVYSREPIDMPVVSSRWISRVEPTSLGRRLSPLLWLKLRGGALCRDDDLDVYWGAAVFFPTLDAGVRTVSTVYDLCFRMTPGTFTFGHLLGVRAFFARDVLGADAVLSISDGTSARLESYVGRKADAVVLPSVSESFHPPASHDISACRQTYGLSSPYVLAVASWEPRKNLERLVHVFLDMKSRGILGDRKLVLVGKRGAKYKRLERLIDDHGRDDVRILGFVPDEQLPPLYAGADVFVCPSVYEGFGIPVLEARACGATVVASDIPELREAGGTDAIYIEPTDEGIRSGIQTALGRARPSAAFAYPTWRDGAAILASALLGKPTEALPRFDSRPS